MRKQIRKAYLALFGYRIHVLGGTWHGTVHRATTYAGALQWAACYRTHVRDSVEVRTWRGAIVGAGLLLALCDRQI